MSDQAITKSATNDIHVVIPGMEAYFQYLQLPYTATLKKFIERAEKTIINNDYYGLLNKLFGYSADNDSGLALAALRHTESRPSSKGMNDYYMCADPVFMQADRDQLLMFDSHDLNIQTHEAEAILKDLNEHFKEEGLEFVRSTNSQWIVRINQLSEVETVALHKVINRPLVNVMPTGEHGKRWKSILNEVQMFLYAHEVNEKRQENGLKPINGIWFWGAGAIPQAANSTMALARLYAREQWIRKLAEINKVEVSSIKDVAAHSINSSPRNTVGHSLYFDAMLSNEFGRLSQKEFMAWLDNTEKNLFKPLDKLLKSGQLDNIYMYPGDGYCYNVKPASILNSVKGFLSSFVVRKKT